MKGHAGGTDATTEASDFCRSEEGFSLPWAQVVHSQIDGSHLFESCPDLLDRLCRMPGRDCVHEPKAPDDIQSG